ncbi:LacI family DNA-binding transcriptional regulator [Niveibacterium sp. SC-1]|uniref:LacI family DNA-binding transcriptional regulator n=1 Tax=Niveibacterium sp. SC-1 TaxID=3135646 RepID=UPI00311EDDB8
MTIKPDMKIRLDEVAAEAGVSPSTVSRFLTGAAKVSEAKRKVVEAAIEKLNYRPNTAARALASGRSMTIGVLTLDISSSFYGEALKGIEQSLIGTDFVPMIVSGELNTKDEAACVEVLLARQVEGLIVFPRQLGTRQLQQIAKRVPLVSIGVKASGPQAHSMQIDNEGGGYMVTRHLTELGHKRIAFVGGTPGHPEVVARRAGYKRALHDAGLKYDPALDVPGNFHESGGIEGTERLLAKGTPFTAVFASNDQSAFGARLALHQAGLRVPEDISVAGFDDLPHACFVSPPLTTIRQPILEMGRRAGRAVVSMLRGEPVNLEIPELELIVRGSTAQPAALLRHWR